MTERQDAPYAIPDLAGKAQTVLGSVAPGALGVTLTHEHLLLDAARLMIEPKEASRRAKFNAPLSIGLLGAIRVGMLPNRDNACIADLDTAIAEATLFKQAGGSTIVDVTSVGLARDPGGLAKIARATGLNVIMGAAYYVAASHPIEMEEKTEDDIVDEIVRDVSVGVDGTGVRAGIIGEVGCTHPMTNNERKVLRAAGRAQRLTGAPLSVHPGRDEAQPKEIVRILLDVNADISRTIICHIDRTVFDRRRLKELAETGCILEYDLFGQEWSYYRPAPHIEMPNDAERLRAIQWLIAEGHGKQIVISQDVDAKYLLTRYGGHGYAHILDNVVPKMRRMEFREDEIEDILVHTPRRLMSFVKPMAN